jgi:ribosomal protein S18 acetylase RimI-like enzyme
MDVQVIRADDSHLDGLLPLFNGYRKFYQQLTDEDGARAYLKARMNNDEAVIFLAVNPDDPNHNVGFVLLYPTFDSVEMMSVWVLHDLFVDPGSRLHGIGRLLMNAAKDFCQKIGASRIDLATATDNKQAQALYESLGYKRDTEFYQYSLEL